QLSGGGTGNRSARPQVGATERRGLLSRGPLARPGGLLAVAVRHQHDRLLDPGGLGPRVCERNRDLRVDGLILRVRHSVVHSRHRHAVMGARQATRLHHAGSDVSRSLGNIGTCIFAVQAVLLVPYIVIAVMGGGTTLSAVSGGLVPFWFGGAVVSLV